METFSALLALCEGNSAATDEFRSKRPVTRGFDVFFIHAWTNSWVNNQDTGDSRRQHGYDDATVI